MAQPSSTAPDEEMRSPLPKPRRFAWFFRPITLLVLCALCAISAGIIVYIRIRPAPQQTFSFPHLQASALRA